ncbi:GNAT family N-acetyltransferase [Candidatus Bathyarchaeota archaeon]|nr:GNAT family N-acetyltransferase [Candidatus Bathyarchaeota archaeon]
MVHFKSMKPGELWLPEHATHASILLEDPLRASPLLVRAMHASRFERFFFASEYQGGIPVGCIHVDYSRLQHVRMAFLGDEKMLEAFLPCLEPSEPCIIQYIPIHLVGFFENHLHVNPTVEYRYLEWVPSRAESFPDAPDMAISFTGFRNLPVDSIVKFYAFPVTSRTLALLDGFDGLVLQESGNGGNMPNASTTGSMRERAVGNGKEHGNGNEPRSIIASVYDNFSKLPVKVQEAVIAGVKVAKKFRNRGYCKLLLQRFLQHLLARDCPRVGLFVHDVNDTAIKCYESVGFVERARYFRCILGGNDQVPGDESLSHAL